MAGVPGLVRLDPRQVRRRRRAFLVAIIALRSDVDEVKDEREARERQIEDEHRTYKRFRGNVLTDAFVTLCSS